MNYPKNTCYTTIPIVTKVTYVVNEVVNGRLVPMFENGNYLVCLAKIIELRKKFPFPYKFKVTSK